MTDPILKRIRESEPPKSLKDDPLFAGHPWEVFVPGRLIEKETYRYRGEYHEIHSWTGKLIKAPTVTRKYFRVPEGLANRTNLAVVYRGAGMFIYRGQVPTFTKPASYKNPQLYDFYAWKPLVYELDGHWMSQQEFVQAVMPNQPHFEPHLTAEQEQEFDQRKRRMAGERELGRVADGTKYVCTCRTKRHTRTIYFDDVDQRPPRRCPDGSSMRLEGGG